VHPHRLGLHHRRVDAIEAETVGDLVSPRLSGNPASISPSSSARTAFALARANWSKTSLSLPRSSRPIEGTTLNDSRENCQRLVKLRGAALYPRGQNASADRQTAQLGHNRDRADGRRRRCPAPAAERVSLVASLGAWDATRP
jgi:hypothetical protein